MKLKTKVAWLIAGSMMITIALIAVLFLEAATRFLPGYNHARLEELSGELAGRLDGTDLHDRDRLAREIEAFSRGHEQVRIELFASDGTLLHTSEPRSEPYTLAEMLERLSNPFRRMFFHQDVSVVYEISAGGEKLFAVFDVDGEALQYLQYFFTLKNWAVLPFLVVPLATIVFLPALLAFAFLFWVTRRLSRLNQAMQRVDLSGEPVLLKNPSRDEIGELTGLYNGMIMKLHEQYRHIRQVEDARSKLVSRLSHDLRTPLSIIRGYAETLQRGSVHERDTRVRHATIILQKSNYMDDQLRKLFYLAQLDDPSQAFRKSEGFLDALLQTVMADYVLILQDKGMEWHLELPDTPVKAAFDREGLTQVIRNLIDNAILHGGGGNFLGVRLNRGDDAVRIEVEDRGKGIPPEETERIFEPFYRVDRGRPSDGLGVGLALAAAIVRQHGGSIDVSSTPHVSTVFRVTLPAADDSSAP
jgi:signal transduction histidine kinase